MEGSAAFAWSRFLHCMSAGRHSTSESLVGVGVDCCTSGLGRVLPDSAWTRWRPWPWEKQLEDMRCLLQEIEGNGIARESTRVALKDGIGMVRCLAHPERQTLHPNLGRGTTPDFATASGQTNGSLMNLQRQPLGSFAKHVHRKPLPIESGPEERGRRQDPFFTHLAKLSA